MKTNIEIQISGKTFKQDCQWDLNISKLSVRKCKNKATNLPDYELTFGKMKVETHKVESTDKAGTFLLVASLPSISTGKLITLNLYKKGYEEYAILFEVNPSCNRIINQQIDDLYIIIKTTHLDIVV